MTEPGEDARVSAPGASPAASGSEPGEHAAPEPPPQGGGARVSNDDAAARSASQAARLEIRGLCKSFRAAEGDLAILAGVDLDAAPGDAVAVLGPSGAGKSTLLHLLGLLEAPTAGTVRLGGVDPFALAPDQQARYRSERVGFIFQEHHLLPHCTVLENVLIPTLAGVAAGATPLARARMLLERVGLGPRLDHRPAQLSGGERQRTAVCRALLNRPSLVLADEPTGSLDRRTASAVGTLLLELAVEQQSILLCVTHSTELADRFPRRYELRDGRLIAL